MEISARNIAELINGEVDGDDSVMIHDVSKIEQGRPGTMTFLSNPQYTKYIYETQASVVLVNKDFKAEQKLNCTLIRVENPYHALATLLDFYVKSKPQKTGVESPSHISSTAVYGENVYIGTFAYIGQHVKIGNNVKIYPHTYIGDNVEVKDDTVIYSGVKIYSDSKIGANCVLHAGAVIGSDGFGFAPDENGAYKKIPQIGNVVVKDNVEIGANTTIDCASMGSTVIEEGTKLDNLVQIGHNVTVGKNNVFAAQTGIAGSTKVGDNCMFGGQTGIAGHINIGNNVQLSAQSGVIKDIKDGETLVAAPATEPKTYFRAHMIFLKLPEIYRQINQLSRTVETLTKAKNKQ